MAYEKIAWKNREVEKPRTYTKVDNSDGTITLTPAEGNIIEPGTPIIADNMNHIEQGIEDVDQAIDTHISDSEKHIPYATASGTNTYTVSISGISSLAEGLSIKVKFTNANTGTATLNVNSLGTKSIVKSNGNALSSGNIKAGQICHLVYTGSNFQLLGEESPVTSVNGKTGVVVLNADNIAETTGRRYMTTTEKTSLSGTVASTENLDGITTSANRQVNASYNSSASNDQTQVNASTGSTASGGYSQVNASDNSVASTFYSQVNASYHSTASGMNSQVNVSERTLNNVAYTMAGGYANSGNPSIANRKWEISSKDGTIKTTGAITGNSTFSDFAEYFESIDGEAIPTGTIVTLEGKKIRPCKEGEEMLGVISETAGVLLNAAGFCWQDRYLRNEFGGLIYEEQYDENIKEYVTVPKENPENNPGEEYVPREERKEWNIVGITGQVYIRCDSSLSVGDYVKSNDNGMATKDDNPQWQKWRVMEVTTPYSEEKGYGVALVFIR
jgi:hypothetical protein